MNYLDPRTSLYTIDELLLGYLRDDRLGFCRTYDFKAFQEFIRTGGRSPISADVRVGQAEHDASISGALAGFLRNRRNIVGFMGGHRVGRDEENYSLIARLAKRVTAEGFLVVTGGGPGVMEAAHLGAAFAHVSDELLGQALEKINEYPRLPRLSNILNPDGAINQERVPELEQVRLWLNAALDAKSLLTAVPGESLAVPTWLYGNEPVMPFATAYAKYFQNSIREESLVTDSRTGIIYSRGGGGTVREIFQDAEQNYYADIGAFTPMIFFDSEDCWRNNVEIDMVTHEVTRPGIKIDDVLTNIFTLARASYGDTEDCLSKIQFTTDHEKITKLLRSQAGSAGRALDLMLEGKSAELPAAPWNR